MERIGQALWKEQQLANSGAAICWLPATASPAIAEKNTK
jgi:hypothetical protein